MSITRNLYTTISAVTLAAIITTQIQAAEPKTFRLWEGDAPNALGTDEKDVPTVIVYLPENAKQPTPVHTNNGSQKNLLGADASAELIKSLSSEKQVTSQTPPTFLCHTAEDKGVPAENSLRFYSAMVTARVPGELHVFNKGRHGLGLAAGSGAAEQWPGLCKKWLTEIGMIDK